MALLFYLQHDQRHVIPLGLATGEAGCSVQNTLDDFLRLSARARTQEPFKRLHSPKFALMVLDLGDAIRVTGQHITNLELKRCGCEFRIRGDSHGCASRLQAEKFALPVARAEHDGGIVSSIYVSQDARGRLIFRVEERCKEMVRRGGMNELIDIRHERRKVRMWMQNLRSKRTLETSHAQGGANSFS